MPEPPDDDPRAPPLPDVTVVLLEPLAGGELAPRAAELFDGTDAPAGRGVAPIFGSSSTRTEVKQCSMVFGHFSMP